jgi:competence protein ComEC
VLHKEIPFLRIGLPLCVGIISGLYFKPDTTFLLIVAFVIASGFAISLFFNKAPANTIYGYTLTLTLFVCGLLLYTKEKSGLSSLKSEPTILACTLSDYPEERENSYRLKLKIHGRIIQNKTEVIIGSLILYNKKDSLMKKLLPGDRLIINCTPAEIVNKGNPYEFDYRFYMENQGIRYYAFTGSRNILSHIVPDHRKMVHRALIIREKIIGMYRARGITGERLALVAAITVGQKNLLDPEQKMNFIRAGVMHIMAVSGLHSVILSLFIFNLLFFMKGRFNILRILITLLLLWAFAFITGLTPSVLRATLMFSFIQAGNLMKRPVNGINSVLASAFVLILIKPSVIFDAGFLLSYSAVIYIISFYRDFYQKLQFNFWLTDNIWQSAVVTIVAQAGTLPLTIMLFNRFPVYFIITNLIIVPLSSLLIILGCIVPMLFPVKFLSQLVATILNYLTGITELLTERAASLPWSNIENIGMTTIQCILLTVTIFVFSCYLLKKRPFSILYPVWLLILFLIAGTVTGIETRITNKVIVYNTPGSSTIGIKTGRILNIYSDTSVAGQEVQRHSATLGLRTKTVVITNKPQFLEAGNKKIFIGPSVNKNIIQSFNPDIVILTGLRPVFEKNLTAQELPGILIITSQASTGFRLPIQFDNALTDRVHFVRKSGAFIRTL